MTIQPDIGSVPSHDSRSTTEPPLTSSEKLAQRTALVLFTLILLVSLLRDGSASDTEAALSHTAAIPELLAELNGDYYPIVVKAFETNPEGAISVFYEIPSLIDPAGMRLQDVRKLDELAQNAVDADNEKNAEADAVMKPVSDLMSKLNLTFVPVTK